MNTFKPIQIMPATNWFAIFEEDNNSFSKLPLVCWALNSEGFITGMIADENGDVTPAHHEDKFKCYDFEFDEYEIETSLLN